MPHHDTLPQEGQTKSVNLNIDPAHFSPLIDPLVDEIAKLDVDTAAAQLSRFARQNPALFAGGAALLGLAAARFLKARPTTGARPSAGGYPDVTS